MAADTKIEWAKNEARAAWLHGARADDPLRGTHAALVCLWEHIEALTARLDARQSELLVANNVEVERRRASEARADAAEMRVREVEDERWLWHSVNDLPNMPDNHFSISDDGDWPVEAWHAERDVTYWIFRAVGIWFLRLQLNGRIVWQRQCESKSDARDIAVRDRNRNRSAALAPAPGEVQQ